MDLRHRSDRRVGKHNAEHQDLYATPNIIKVIRRKTMRWAEIVESMETKINEYRVLDEKLRKKGSLAKHRCSLKGNIKVGLKDWGLMVRNVFFRLTEKSGEF